MDVRPYRVCIFGASLDTGNMGVSALAASLIKIITEIRNEACISLLIGSPSPCSRTLELPDKAVDVRIVNYRLSPKSRIREHLFWILVMSCLHRVTPSSRIQKAISRHCPWIGVLNEADFIGDVRGGDSFSDIYGLKRILLESLPPLTALILKKRLVLLPQTYGPYLSRIAQRIACFFFRRSELILSRDEESLELVDRLLGGKSKTKVQMCPDVAFLLDSKIPDNLNILPPLPARNDEAPLIGLNINGLLYNGGYTRDNMFALKYDYKDFVHRLMDKLSRETGARILLIPHTFAPPGHVESDNDACRLVYRLFCDTQKDRFHLARGTYDQFSIKGIIGLCDFFIGSRMHACVAALSQGIPAVAVAYSRKFAGVYDAVGASDLVVDARLCDLDTSINRIYDHFLNRDHFRMILKKRMDGAQQRLWAVFRTLLRPDKYGPQTMPISSSR